MYLFIDDCFKKNNQLNVTGWHYGNSKKSRVEFHVLSGGQEIPFRITFGKRPDVGYAYFNDPSDYDFGYFLEIPDASGKKYVIRITEKDGESEDSAEVAISVPLIPLIKKYREMRQRITELREKLGHYLRRDYHAYTEWFHHVRVTPEELSVQRSACLPAEPRISILVPVYRTKPRYLKEMLNSVLLQSYSNWELCIVNADPGDAEVGRILKEYAASDARIQVRDLPENQGISANTNEAFSMASGEFVGLLDHDDTLEPDALYEYVSLLNNRPDTDLLYCDEDKMRDATDYYYYPNFKPDYNPDMLYNNNYICHFLMVRASLMRELGGMRSDFDGAQDYDFLLRALEKTERIEHIPRVLYHWRTAATSTAKNAGTKDYAGDAGERAINEAYVRRGIHAKAACSPIAGWYKSKYTMTREPLISVIIPNKDHTDDLDICIESLKKRCTYRNLEIIVIENNSTEPETFAYYEELKKRYPDIVILYYKDKFNYSRINNFGFRASHGELILLLNNDTEAVSEDLFENMAAFLERPEVGAVGARLLYADNTVQHAGVLVGAGGLADHMFKGYKASKPCYMCRSITTQDVSCVTAACLMVKRSVYEEVGGLDESFEVAFNDVDFCLKIREKGHLIVYDADAVMHHYESKSRGSENTPEKFLRFSGEVSRLSNKWKVLKGYTDPYYNPNMSYLMYFKPDPKVMNQRAGERVAYRKELLKGEDDEWDEDSARDGRGQRSRLRRRKGASEK